MTSVTHEARGWFNGDVVEAIVMVGSDMTTGTVKAEIRL